MKTSKETVMKNPKGSFKKTKIFKLDVEKFHFLKYKNFFIFSNSASYFLNYRFGKL